MARAARAVEASCFERRGPEAPRVDAERQRRLLGRNDSRYEVGRRREDLAALQRVAEQHVGWVRRQVGLSWTERGDGVADGLRRGDVAARASGPHGDDLVEEGEELGRRLVHDDDHRQAASRQLPRAHRERQRRAGVLARREFVETENRRQDQQPDRHEQSPVQAFRQPVDPRAVVGPQARLERDCRRALEARRGRPV